MKYTNEIIIDLPVARVVELFDNPENLKKWQPNLVSFEAVSGIPGQPGAKSKLKYINGKREMVLTETVIKRDLPREFTGSYEAKGVYNLSRNFFVPLPDNKTKYMAENEFRFDGLFLKLIGFLMPGAFKSQTKKYMQYFKDFAEKEK